MEHKNNYEALKNTVEETLNLKIREDAINSIISEALEKLPEIKSNMPFGSENENITLNKERYGNLAPFGEMREQLAEKVTNKK